MKIFSTDKQESRRTLWFRLIYNILPPIRGTGSWLRFLSGDWHEAHVSMKLNLKTRNYVGTIFGGAMFSGSDPIYMIQLFNILGKDYIVWDKSAHIRFLRPGTGKIRAHFLIKPEEVEEIKEAVREHKEVDRTFVATWINEKNKAVCRIEKTIYIADKKHYKEKKQRRVSKVEKTPT
ncbi:MAG: DUF4442 domain-containing protein [Bacteroidota bacterium]